MQFHPTQEFFLFFFFFLLYNLLVKMKKNKKEGKWDLGFGILSIYSEKAES